MAVDYSYFPFILILEAVVCDPAEDPSSCPTNRRCEDSDGDGEYNCVCDKRFYTTHTLGHCVLGKQKNHMIVPIFISQHQMKVLIFLRQRLNSMKKNLTKKCLIYFRFQGACIRHGKRARGS